MSGLTPRPGIMDIQPYVGGQSTAEGAERVYKLASNENDLGPSPDAIKAYHDAAANSIDIPTAARMRFGPPLPRSMVSTPTALSAVVDRTRS